MKEQLLFKLDNVLSIGDSIKDHADEVAQIREKLDELLTDDEKYTLTSRIKTRVQAEAELAWHLAGERGAVLAATGVGKSRIGVNLAKRKTGRGLLVVPTERLRDTNWRLEFEKWEGEEAYTRVIRCCYASLNKFEREHFDYVILDEGHNITENNSVFFNNNTVDSVLMLTATRPRDEVKKEVLTRLGINPVYELTLDQGVKLGLVAPYEITVVTLTLDNVDKYVESGNKNNRFFQTESAKYQYLSKVCNSAPSKDNFLKRMRFVYSLRSKTNAARWLLQNTIPKENLRTLIFCGGIEQAESLSKHTFHSKTNDTWLDMFMDKEIDQLYCVNSLNEGHNIPDLDCSLIIQLNSNDLHLVQRLGRNLRYRPGHVGRIIILCVRDTVDFNWVNKAIEELDSDKITWVDFNKIRSGEHILSF